MPGFNLSVKGPMYKITLSMYSQTCSQRSTKIIDKIDRLEQVAVKGDN